MSAARCFRWTGPPWYNGEEMAPLPIGPACADATHAFSAVFFGKSRFRAAFFAGLQQAEEQKANGIDGQIGADMDKPGGI